MDLFDSFHSTRHIIGDEDIELGLTVRTPEGAIQDLNLPLSEPNEEGLREATLPGIDEEDDPLTISFQRGQKVEHGTPIEAESKKTGHKYLIGAVVVAGVGVSIAGATAGVRWLRRSK